MKTPSVVCRSGILLLIPCLVVADAAFAIDTVKRKGQDSVLGRISSMDSKKVVVTRGAAKTSVPVQEIDTIVFDGEPPALSLARANVAHGRYEDAMRGLDEIKTGEIKSKMIRADVEFLQAFCAAQLAMRGEGNISEAGRRMDRFASAHRDNYRWFEANRLVGDLLVANRLYDRAIDYYAKPADSPAVEYQIRAVVDIGWAQLAAGKFDEALASFDKAMTMQADEDGRAKAAVAAQHALAEIGRVRCLAAKGMADDAVKQIREIIARTDPKDVVLGARAHNALGTALRAADRPQDALLAFLHVDVLYSSSPEDHAEALANLAELWQEVRRTDRAIQAQETLRLRYKNSRWAPR
ncbi:MAG: hypothetical protein GX621_13585 [Pirellulaceae bacterium]|nr:hypothetical protein [Pirellulaceae bacterium]